MSLSAEDVVRIERNTESIRNICVLAHVDHGKTTLSDFLIASNGIISSKMAGRMRYMDFREDEQQRCITMKSASISLFYLLEKVPYIIHLVDSPGHVDFSSEVSTAVRLCDGGIVIVDVVEGVCTQTQVVLEQAYREGLKTCLVLNKVDRLLEELQMSPMEAYQQLQRVLEQVNAVQSSIMQAEVLDGGDDVGVRSSSGDGDGDRHDYARVGEEKDDTGSLRTDSIDSDAFFSPLRGNVVFGSAVNGWGFSISQFANILSTKIGMREDVLTKTLWGDYYFNKKKGKVSSHPSYAGQEPLFVQMIMRNICEVYDAVMLHPDPAKIDAIVSKLKLTVPRRGLKDRSDAMLRAILGEWLPLHETILNMVVKTLPSPKSAQPYRIPRIIPDVFDEDLIHQMTEKDQEFQVSLRHSLLQCNGSRDAPTIVFISKMMEADPSAVSISGSRVSVPQKRDATFLQQLKRKDQSIDGESRTGGEKKIQTKEEKEGRGSDEQPAGSSDSVKDDTEEKNDDVKEEESVKDSLFVEETKYVGFCRIFSGNIRVGDRVFVFDKKHRPTEISVLSLFLFMGRTMRAVPEVPVGNIFGLIGITNAMVKYATLASDVRVPNFKMLQFAGYPIVRVAVETRNAKDMPQLYRALMELNRMDPCVQVVVQETGEHVIAAAGEVHVERCLKDLRETIAPELSLIVSPPIVGFRETIVDGPPRRGDGMGRIEHLSCKVLISIRQLPEEIVCYIESYSGSQHHITSSLAGKMLKHGIVASKDEFTSRFGCLGPRHRGANMLLFSPFACSLPDQMKEYLVSGFQIATRSGPLCEEPMMGVLFEVLEVSVGDPRDISGQLISRMNQTCRKLFLDAQCRIKEPVYRCNVRTTELMLGKTHAVLARRRAKILSEDIQEGTSIFVIECLLPVAESFGFGEELRKKTSGAAIPVLQFDRWQTVEEDPFFVPTTQEEKEEFGALLDAPIRALEMINDVRRRKGLFVDDKIVEHGDKQRTLKRNK